MSLVSQDSDKKEKRSHSVHESSDEKKHATEESADVAVYEAGNGDEALKLVGTERTTEFSEEYNAKLRRKLVSSSMNCLRLLLHSLHCRTLSYHRFAQPYISLSFCKHSSF